MHSGTCHPTPLYTRTTVRTSVSSSHPAFSCQQLSHISLWLPCHHRLLHVRNGNCKYHLGEETFKLAQSYMEKLAKHGHQANKAALYGELCALLFAKSHYDEVGPTGNDWTFLWADLASVNKVWVLCCLKWWWFTIIVIHSVLGLVFVEHHWGVHNYTTFQILPGDDSTRNCWQILNQF